MTRMFFPLILLVSAVVVGFFISLPVFGGVDRGNSDYSGDIGGIFSGLSGDCLSPSGFLDCVIGTTAGLPLSNTVSSTERGSFATSLTSPSFGAADPPRLGSGDGIFLVGDVVR